MTQIIGYRSDNLEIVKLYVKKAFTTVTKTYSINVNAPLREIMEFILNNAINDLDFVSTNDRVLFFRDGQNLKFVNSMLREIFKLNLNIEIKYNNLKHIHEFLFNDERNKLILFD